MLDTAPWHGRRFRGGTLRCGSCPIPVLLESSAYLIETNARPHLMQILIARAANGDFLSRRWVCQATDAVPSAFVRTLDTDGSLTPLSFLALTSTSYSVSGFKPSKPHEVRGVSNP